MSDLEKLNQMTMREYILANYTSCFWKQWRPSLHHTCVLSVTLQTVEPFPFDVRCDWLSRPACSFLTGNQWSTGGRA